MQHYCKHSSERWDGHWQQLMLMMCGRQYLRMETAHAALINTVITMKVCVFLCCIGPSSQNTAPQSRANPGSNQGADNWASTWIHSASRRRRKNLEQFKLVPLCLHKRNICSASEPFSPPPFPSFLFFSSHSWLLFLPPLFLHFLLCTPVSLRLTHSVLTGCESVSSSPSLSLSGRCGAAEVNLTLFAFLMSALWKALCCETQAGATK